MYTSTAGPTSNTSEKLRSGIPAERLFGYVFPGLQAYTSPKGDILAMRSSRECDTTYSYATLSFLHQSINQDMKESKE